MEKRIADLEERVAKLEAAAGTAAFLKEQLQLLEVRKRRVEMRITDPEARQRILVALEKQVQILQQLKAGQLRMCVACEEKEATLELDDGKFICETCAQIQGELAP